MKNITKSLAVCFTYLLLSGCSTLKREPINVACIGDSITYGSQIKDREKNSYPAQLAIKLGSHAVVKNYGVSGATLLKKGDKPYWKLKQYQQALKFQPDVVIIKLGSNDSKTKNWKHKSEYIENYIELIQSFKNLKSKPTVWISYPVPAYSTRFTITNESIVNDMIPMIDEIAKVTDVNIIDLHSALSNKPEMFPDAIHPNAEGATLMMETIYNTVF